MSQTPVVIEQAISAGGQFDETLPPGTPTDNQAIRVFPAAATGGEFVFDFTGPDASFVTYQIDQIFIDFADAATAEIAIVDSKDAYQDRPRISRKWHLSVDDPLPPGVGPEGNPEDAGGLPGDDCPGDG